MTTTLYPDHYSPELLFPIARQEKRRHLGISHELPFRGFDRWTAFELSWLNKRGKPVVAIGEFIFPCDSPYLIESKSLKLYLNSLNNTLFQSTQKVHDTIYQDLSNAAGSKMEMTICPLAQWNKPQAFAGKCIDDQAITCETYTVDPSLLLSAVNKKDTQPITETLYSDLLKSNCPVTGQPDWASIQITYTGKKIKQANLLKYLISYRNHSGFHEECVERIFLDILTHCSPKKLTVYARYTRRGGIDINPYRSTEPHAMPRSIRLHRQ